LAKSIAALTTTYFLDWIAVWWLEHLRIAAELVAGSRTRK
jgi:hypothetical protein